MDIEKFLSKINVQIMSKMVQKNEFPKSKNEGLLLFQIGLFLISNRSVMFIGQKWDFIQTINGYLREQKRKLTIFQ